MRLLTKTLLAAALLTAAPMAANAESTFINGTGNATARLDFQITVPRILFLRVGTGADFTTNPTINQIAFVVPAANVGDGTAIAATAASGDLNNGAVTAKVLGNNGTITLTSNTSGPLSNGTDTISYSQINTAVAVLTPGTPLAHPTLADGAGTTPVTIIPTTGKSVTRDAKWTYTYANSAIVAPGTYGGVNTNGSRVTYTAAMP